MRPVSILCLATVFSIVLGSIGGESPVVTANAANPVAESIAGDAETLENGSIRARQKVLARVGSQPGARADELLLSQFTQFEKGELHPALWLDLLEAMAKRENPEIKARLAEREKALEKSPDPLSRYRECLEGGHAEAGRALFSEKPEAGCIRCHKVQGKGGEIGPDLTGLHQTTERIYILESIVDPNAVITPGFQNILLTLKNGDTVTGIFNSERDDEITITSTIDGKKRKVKAQDVTDRTPLPSAMPPGFGVVLGKRAIRDLVEYLATLEQE